MTLPTFLVIGAAKSGTTSLHHYLGQHPDIYMSRVKEPGFFAFEGHRLDFNGPGDEWIKQTVSTSLPQYLANFYGVTSETAVGESSPVYLYAPEAPQRIGRQLPDARLVAILRNPAERAYSQFLFFLQVGREPLRDFDAALDQEEQRINANWAWGWHYSRVGFYHTQLSRYAEIFDRSRFRIHLYEDLRDHPAATLRSIFEFLDVDPDFEPDLSRRHNVTKPALAKPLDDLIRKPNPARSVFKALTTARFRRRIASSPALAAIGNQPELRPETTERLAGMYRTDILKLQDFIERDLSSWLP